MMCSRFYDLALFRLPLLWAMFSRGLRPRMTDRSCDGAAFRLVASLWQTAV